MGSLYCRRGAEAEGIGLCQGAEYHSATQYPYLVRLFHSLWDSCKAHQTSETLSRLESRGGTQHNNLMSKILEHRAQLDDVSRNVEEVKKEAKSCHQEFKSDFSSLANDVRSKFDKVMASSSSVSGDLNIVSATVRATQSSLEDVSTTLSSAQTTLMSLRDIGFQIKQFLCTFPAELRGLLQNILRTNMQMYFMLLNIHSSVGASPSNQGSSKFKLEDALGVVRELPYEWFRHWEVCLVRRALGIS